MAATNAINLYITTCRYVIQSNPYDPETWGDLYRYLPYLRQSLSCCVCRQILHIPMGPTESPCQHHVCKECIGGKMRLKPTCGWCKDYSEFVENPILRTVIQCLKKLCQYLASSAIAINIENTNNGGNAALMTAIQDGVNIKDDHTSSTGSHLRLFPPKLQKVNSRRASKEERNTQHEEEISSKNKGEGHSEGSGCSTNCGQNKLNESFAKKGKSEGNARQAKQNEKSNEDNIGKSKRPESPVTTPERKGHRRKKRGSESCDRGKSKQSINGQNHKSELENGINKELIENSLYETVAAEHDYNRESTHGTNPNPALKVRIRKIEGDHESLIKRPKHVAEPVFDHILVNNCLNGDVDTNVGINNVHIPSKIDNNNDALSSLDDQNKNKSLSIKKRHIIAGCRCGMATPNPGKLTCCGQRCPCYSTFKGCVDCKCRGCRNPRGDKPAPNSLKVQLQQQNLTTQSHLPLVGSSPQLIITPIKMEHHNDSDIDIDI